jgi:hypothetical protein
MMRNRPRTTAQRGYGHHHQKMRRKYASLVASGRAWCARCGEPIEPGEPWDLGHDDYDRSKYMGPEHARCNRGAPNRCTTSRAW